MPPIFLLTGFEPFGGDRSNPSWLVARNLDGDRISGLQVKSVKIPVSCAGAARRVTAAIVRYRPKAVLGLGQAGGRPHVSLEQVAINLAQAGARGEHGVGGATRPVIARAPEAYFARLPLEAIVRELKRKEIPAAVSLTAGAYACNALMYAALHALKRRPSVPAGFLHLPYEPRQAARRREAVASMSLDMMERAVRLAIAMIARST